MDRVKKLIKMQQSSDLTIFTKAIHLPVYIFSFLRVGLLIIIQALKFNKKEKDIFLVDRDVLSNKGYFGKVISPSIYHF
jgi:hypothetical protein